MNELDIGLSYGQVLDTDAQAELFDQVFTESTKQTAKGLVKEYVFDPIAAAAAFMSLTVCQYYYYSAEDDLKGGYLRWNDCYWEVYPILLLKSDLKLLFGDAARLKMRFIIDEIKTTSPMPITDFDDCGRVGEKLILANGIYDLKSESMIPHLPVYLNRSTISVTLDAAKTACPKFHEFLDRFMPNLAGQALLQDVMGYCLCPFLQYQVVIVIFGPRGSGKSTFLDILRRLIGARNVSHVPSEALHLPHGLEPFVNPVKCVNICDESGALDPQAETIIKTISGGTPVTINRKYQPAYSLTLPTRIIICSNDLPRFSDLSDALYSRLVMLPFSQAIDLEHVARTKEDVVNEIINEESSGILWWAIQGLQRLRRATGNRRGRFTSYGPSEDAVIDHHDYSNPFHLWLDECTARGPALTVGKGDAYSDYRRWCMQNGHAPVASNTHGRELKKLDGITEKRVSVGGAGSKRRRIWCGIGLVGDRL